MKKQNKRLLIYIAESVAFCAIMAFGIIYGPQHPQIFFWGVMAVFATIIANEIAPTLKDAIILIARLLVLAIAGTAIDKLVSHLFGSDTFIGFVITGILLAPFYFPLACHFMNMCKKMVKRLEEEVESESE